MAPDDIYKEPLSSLFTKGEQPGVGVWVCPDQLVIGLPHVIARSHIIDPGDIARWIGVNRVGRLGFYSKGPSISDEQACYIRAPGLPVQEFFLVDIGPGASSGLNDFACGQDHLKAEQVLVHGP